MNPFHHSRINLLISSSYMGKDKLKRFKENVTFTNLIQPKIIYPPEVPSKIRTLIEAAVSSHN